MGSCGLREFLGSGAWGLGGSLVLFGFRCPIALGLAVVGGGPWDLGVAAHLRPRGMLESYSECTGPPAMHGP